MDEDRHIELADFLIERPQHLRIEIAVFMPSHQFDAPEA
jgi:hypothetical protein